MNIAFFGYNLFSSCLHFLEAHAYTIKLIFTGIKSNYTDKVHQFAHEHRCPLSIDKPETKRLHDLLRSHRIDMILCAEYPFILPVPDFVPYAINLHTSLLPFGRGPTPLPWLLSQYPEHSGLTFHKMSRDVDQGDILLQRAVPIDGDSCETLLAKYMIEAPRLLWQLLENLDGLYAQAQPQGKGSYWPVFPIEAQSFNWTDSIEQILAVVQRMGRYGAKAHLQSRAVSITGAEGFRQNHHFEPGTILYSDSIHLIIAAGDGYLTVPQRAVFSNN